MTLVGHRSDLKYFKTHWSYFFLTITQRYDVCHFSSCILVVIHVVISYQFLRISFLWVGINDLVQSRQQALSWTSDDWEMSVTPEGITRPCLYMAAVHLASSYSDSIYPCLRVCSRNFENGVQGLVLLLCYGAVASWLANGSAAFIWKLHCHWLRSLELCHIPMVILALEM